MGMLQVCKCIRVSVDHKIAMARSRQVFCTGKKAEERDDGGQQQQKADAGDCSRCS